MVISVKYALDAQNNVGIFSADLDPGDMTIVFREEKDSQIFQVALINENGKLYVRIVDPDREQRGETAKIRKEAFVNEVFSVGSATIMIMAITGGESSKVNSGVFEIDPDSSLLEGSIKPAKTVQESRPPNIGAAPIATAGPASIPVAPKPIPVPAAVPYVPKQNALPADMPMDDSFAKNLHTEVDPSTLPPVEGSRLNYNYQHIDDRQPKVEEKKEAEVVPPKAVAPRKEEKPDQRNRAEIHKMPKSRDQLLREDVRDRRFYLKGAKYSLRNKISALVLSLGITGIGFYSLGVSHLSKKSHSLVFGDSVQSLTNLKAQELRTRIKNYNSVLSTIVQTVTNQKVDNQIVSKTFMGFDFIVGVGAYRFLPASEVEPPPQHPVPIANKSNKRSAASLPAPPAPPKYDLSRLKKLEDGNYIEPVVQWVKESEAVALQLDSNKLRENQLTRIVNMLAKGTAPPVLDFKEISLPAEEKGIYTYVVRDQPISPMFIVIQTSSNYFNEVFRQQNDNEYYLIENKSKIIFPASARDDSNLMGVFQGYLALSHAQRLPAASNNYLAAVPVTATWDLVSRPGSNRAMETQGDAKLFLIFGALILMVFLGVGVWFAKHISAPLVSLVNQIESVAAGDYYRRFEIESSDEVGQVADYFQYLTQTLKRKEQTLAVVTDLASKDALTSMHNHRYFRTHLETKWKEIESKGGALILIDIDDFRMFNFAHGHIQGDMILKELALCINETVKDSGVTARYGGEEFVVWMSGANQKTSFDLAEKILNKIRAVKFTNLTGGAPFTVGCSLGVLTFTKGRHLTIDKFLMDADSNVVMAKKAGKNRIWAGNLT